MKYRLQENVDPVSIVMKGTKEEIFTDVKRCVEIGSKAKKGYTLATGCDIPETTESTEDRLVHGYESKSMRGNIRDKIYPFFAIGTIYSY